MIRHFSKGLFIAVCFLVLAFSSHARADVVYSTFGPGMSYMTYGAIGIGSVLPSGDYAFQSEIAVSFVPASTYKLDYIDFVAKYSGGPNQLTVNLAADASGAPGTILESWSFTNLSSLQSIYTAVSRDHPLLKAADRYWVWITTNDLLNSNLAWFFNNQGYLGLDSRFYGATFWSSQPNYITPVFDVVGSRVFERADIIIYDTGTNSIGTTGLTGGTAVWSEQYLGVKFLSPGDYITTEIGGHFSGDYGDTIFGAVVRLDGPTDIPNSGNLSTDDVIGYSVFGVPRYSDVVWGSISVPIKKGVWYALIFGTGLFGSSGHAATPFEGVTTYTMGYPFWYNVLEDRYYNADLAYPSGPISGYWGLRGIPTTNPYIFYGFFSPVDNLPMVNDAKAGQAIPVKWRITDINGVPISDPASFKNLASYEITCDSLSGDSTSSVEEYETGSSGLQYAGDGSWQFNWTTVKTYAGQCRKMVLTLGDGSTHEASFKFK